MRNGSFFRRNPFSRLIVFYAAGLIAARYSDNSPLIILSAILLVLTALLFRYNPTERLRHLRGMLVFLMLAFTGYFSYTLHTRHGELPADRSCYLGISVSPLIQKSHHSQTDCLVSAVLQGDSLVRIREKVRLYIHSEEKELSLRIGDSVRFVGHLSPVKNRGNPGEFNYTGYLFNEGIRYSAYLSEEDLYPGGNSGKKPVARLAANIRKGMIDLFREKGLADAELGVIAALVAGERQYLSDEVRRNYAHAGAMHILAVSGLHVGILFLFLNLLFGSRCRLPWYRLIRMVVILASLWAYAFIAGLSTSVIRASLMFSLLQTGKNFRQSTSSYNMVFASALIILLFDPSELFMAGFQFSYLAVLGILFFQPRLESLILFKTTLPDRIWQLITVSLAAQITTFPLALFYFHQFPVYFLLTNLFIIPLIWLIMMNTLLLFFVSFSEALSGVVARLLNFLLILTNRIISLISSFPTSVLSNIRFEGYHLLILFPALLLLMHSLAFHKLNRIPPLLLLSCILCSAANIVVYSKQEKECQLIIYNQMDQHLISYIQGHQHLLISRARDTSTLRSSLEYMKPYLVSRQIEKTQQRIRLEECRNAEIRTGSLRLLVDSSSWSLELDSMIISYQNCQPDPYKQNLLLIDRDSGWPSQLRSCPDGIILFRGISYRQRTAWMKYAENSLVRLHDMNLEGAFILPLQE